MNLLIAPSPDGHGGPALAIKRIEPYLPDYGYHVVPDPRSKWDIGLINVTGGRLGIRVLLSRKPFIYRAAGYYVRSIYQDANRKWTWHYDFFNSLIRLYLHRAQWIVYQSKYAQKMLSELVPSTLSRSSIIHNGVDLDVFRPLTRERHEYFIIGCAGKLRHERVNDLVKVSKQLPLPHQILVVGSMPKQDRIFLEQHCKDRNIPCIITGFVSPDELPQLYNCIDVFMHLAAADVCPNVVVEALACGTPVICHAYGGTAELIEGAGYAVPGNLASSDQEFISGVVDATQRIVEDLSRYRHLARERARSALDIRLTASGYVSALDKAAHIQRKNG